MTLLHYKISKQAQSELTDVVGLFYLLTNGYAKMKLEKGVVAVNRTLDEEELSICDQ
jgi:hypothetical protein